MSATQVSAARSTALEIAAMLARYERHVRRLAATWLDMELYALVSREIDEIRLRCALLPDTAAACSQLLISHAELVHALWREDQAACNQPHADATDLLHLHLASIDLLARRCLRTGDPPKP